MMESSTNSIIKSNSRRKLWKYRENKNLCIYCGLNSPNQSQKGCLDCLDKKVKSTNDYSKRNREKINQYNLLIKHIVIEKYGGCCACCGESQIMFLTIDHKNNDGSIERNRQPYNTHSFYMKLKKNDIRDDIQVLCFNCNLGKSINKGVCPHEKVNRVLSPLYDKRHIPRFDTRLKIVWPNDDDLIEMCNKKSISQVSRDLGVDFSAVSGRLKRRGKYDFVKKKSGGIMMGESNPSSKLKKLDVDRIKYLISSGISRSIIASEFSVSIGLIDKIAQNKLWKIDQSVSTDIEKENLK